MFSMLTIWLVLLSVACAQPRAPTTGESSRLVTSSNQVEASTKPEDRARSLLENLRNGQPARAYEMLEVSARSQITAAQLEQSWAQLQQQGGAFIAVKELRQTRQGASTMVDQICEFAKGAIVLRVAVDAKGQLLGIWFLPVEQALPRSVPPAAYVKFERFTEREVSFGDPEWLLAGTLTIPRSSGPHPIVVMLSGSGPNDRDETVGPNKPFRDLAQGLATAGIASLRYDKRTFSYADRLPPLDVSFEDEVLADARHALAFVRSQKEVDPARVILLGHSLGAVAAPLLAANDGELVGIALLAPPARPISVLLDEQTKYIATLSSHQTPEEQAQLQAVQAAMAQYHAGKLPDDANLLGASVRYWKDIDARQPIAAALELRMPIFIAHGGQDYQVPQKDFDMWKERLAGRSKISVKEYPSANHIFVKQGYRQRPAPEDYVLEAGPVDETVVNDLSAWVQALGQGEP